MPTHVLLLLENVDLGIVEARVFPHVVRHLEGIRREEVGEVEHAVFLVPVAGRLPMRQVDPCELLREEKAARHTFERVVPRVRELAEDVALGAEVIRAVEDLHVQGQPKTAFASEPRPEAHAGRPP